MKKFQKVLVIGAVVATIGAGAFSVSAAAVSPADILAGLTGQTSESIVQQRADGDTYGAIAAEYDVLDAFHDEMTANLAEILAERVADGTLTQERADAILEAHEAREEACDGTGRQRRLARSRRRDGAGGRRAPRSGPPRRHRPRRSVTDIGLMVRRPPRNPGELPR